MGYVPFCIVAKEWFGFTGCLSCWHLSRPGHVFFPELIEFLICMGKKIFEKEVQISSDLFWLSPNWQTHLTCLWWNILEHKVVHSQCSVYGNLPIYRELLHIILG